MTRESAVSTAHDIDGALIIGAGLGGLFTALKLAPLPCVVLSPEALGDGASSAWAQGGMAAAVGEGDTAEAHAADTVSAGAGIVDEAVALMVTQNARARVLDLLSYGTPFDRNADGSFLQSKEAAHSTNRVIRVSGDRAGQAIMDALIHAARNTPSIQILEGVTVDDLLTHEGAVVGAVARQVLDATAAPLVFRAPHTVLATGGLGGLYAVTTNPARVRGQGIGMAARAGAVISDAEFVQFHPTGMAVDRDPCPLATEALRGHGATVIDDAGHRFILDDHPDGELAPRDIVARAIHRKVSAGEPVFLDTRESIGAGILEEFPTVAGYCRDAGIDPVTEPIPIRPAQHYHMGGVRTDDEGRASLPGLWACGEVSSTGLHGANRLASNSLLEAVVFGARIAHAIAADLDGSRALPHIALPEYLHTGPEFAAPVGAVRILRETMSLHVGVERTANGLATALRVFAELEAEHAPQSRAFLNMTTTATLVAAAALMREESRGGHARADFPTPDRTLQSRSHVTLSEALARRAEVIASLP
ncbi:MAG: L-aspartate oxidase [Pseudomonadota bacterium]